MERRDKQKEPVKEGKEEKKPEGQVRPARQGHQNRSQQIQIYIYLANAATEDRKTTITLASVRPAWSQVHKPDCRKGPALQADSLPAEPQEKPPNTGVCSLSLLQGIFLTQESNQGLPHCTWVPYQLSHKESPRILEWVAYPFSRGFSQSGNCTGVSCIAGRFLRRAYKAEKKKRSKMQRSKGKIYPSNVEFENVMEI